MSKHTPGPWEMVRDIGIKVHRSEPIPKGARYAIAQIGVGRGDSEDEANARLIAAAPDLLAACNHAARILDRNDSGIWESEYEPMEAAWRLLHEAIEKAEGK